VEGYSSVLYRKKHLENFDMETNILSIGCYKGDDFILSNHLRKHKIPILYYESYPNILEYGLGEDALHRTENGNIANYKICADYLSNKNDLHIRYDIHQLQRTD
jgi:hypothetical protein